MKKAFVICLVVLIAVNSVTSRWLPTRSEGDRLDKLREMLRDILESEIERTHYDVRPVYKRDVGTQVEKLQRAEEPKKTGEIQNLVNFENH